MDLRALKDFIIADQYLNEQGNIEFLQPTFVFGAETFESYSKPPGPLASSATGLGLYLQNLSKPSHVGG